MLKTSFLIKGKLTGETCPLLVIAIPTIKRLQANYENLKEKSQYNVFLSVFDYLWGFVASTGIKRSSDWRQTGGCKIFTTI